MLCFFQRFHRGFNWDKLIRRIKEVHPDLDLLFLTEGGVESLNATFKGKGADAGVGPVLNETEADRTHPD